MENSYSLMGAHKRWHQLLFVASLLTGALLGILVATSTCSLYVHEPLVMSRRARRAGRFLTYNSTRGSPSNARDYHAIQHTTSLGGTPTTLKGSTTTKGLSVDSYSAETKSYAGGFPVACTSNSVTKQTCMFTKVCLRPSSDRKALTAVMWSSHQQEHAAVLQHHLSKAFQGVLAVSTQVAPYSNSTQEAVYYQQEPTIIWSPHPSNQESFGHALVNEAYPIFMVLLNHFGHNVPTNIQFLNSRGGWNLVLQHVIMDTITKDAALFNDKLAGAVNDSGMCFQQLILGDGGYVSASRASLANSGAPHAKQYGLEPSFFSSANWWQFRHHTFKINGLPLDRPATEGKKRIVLNDKRYGQNGAADRRMILDVEALAANLTALYPGVQAQPVRFRDLAWAQQLQTLAEADVFISTQGSSAFRLVFLPPGATCIMIGAPAGENTDWASFHELDRWFPLTYVQFKRYEIQVQQTDEYEVKVVTGWWQPTDEKARRNWWLYNSNARVKVERLQQMLNGVVTGS